MHLMKTFCIRNTCTFTTLARISPFYAATSDKLKSTGWSDPNQENCETGGKYTPSPIEFLLEMALPKVDLKI